MNEANFDQNARMWGMICHLSLFAGYVVPCAGIAAPIVIWMMKKEDSELIDYHGRECLNLWLTSVIFSLLMVVISIATMGIGAVVAVPLIILWSLAMFIFTIIAAIKAFDGKAYRIPMILRML